ncbi:MAG: DUF5667 domain-containing protein [Candidatus Paceibacterota bacterium]
MKNNSLHQGAQKIRAITLSPKEKAAVLARLLEHVAQHPARIVSPWRVYVSQFRFEVAMATVLVMLVTGGSVASAAKGALPGDLLYPVKISVLEPAQGLFVTGDVPRAHWAALKTVRRLEEAETLAAQGRLNPSVIEAVKNNFEKSANEFNAIVESAQTGGSSEQIVDASVDFEARVNAHAQILSAVGQGPGDSQTDDLSSLRNSVEENAHKAREQRASATARFLKRGEQEGYASSTESRRREASQTRSSEDDRTQALFDDRVHAIETMITSTEGRLHDATSSVSTTTSSVQEGILRNVPETLRAAEDALKEARQRQDSGDADKAYSALLDSESAAKQADTSLEQGLRWGKEKDKEKKENEDSKQRSGDRQRFEGGEGD